MAQITPSSLDFLYKTGNATFQKALTDSPVIYPEICEQLPVSGAVTVNYFLDRIPTMRKWVGPRVVNAMVARGRLVEMVTYEDTVSINRNNYEDDEALSVGLYNRGVQLLGSAAAKHPDVIRAQFLASANSTVGYDGVAIYSTSHPINGGGSGGPSGTQSNLLVSTALTYDNLGVARETMRTWVGADGQPLTVEPTHIEVPPQLETEARQLLEGALIPNTAGTATQTNIWVGSLKLIVNPYLSGKPNNWYLHSASTLKPFVVYDRQKPRFSQQFDPNSEATFRRNEYEFGVDSRFGVSETMWWLTLAATSGGSY